MTETIPENKKEFLNQLSQIHGIPVQDLTKYYEKQLNNPVLTEHIEFKGNFPKLLDYIDGTINGFIESFTNTVMEEVELFIITSQTPRLSKSGQLTSADIAIAKRTSNTDKPKYIQIRNNEDDGRIGRIPPLSTGKMMVNIRTETEQTIEAFSRSSSTFNPQPISFVPSDLKGKIDYLRAMIKQVEIANAAKNLSSKGENGYLNPFSLRMIEGTISKRLIGKSIDEDSKTEREYAIINIVDKSVSLKTDFFKDKIIIDPKNPTQTIKLYGGFSGFCEPDDVRDKDKGTLALYIGAITENKDTKQVGMNINTIIPLVVIAPKKPTERLQKPNTPPAQKSGIDPVAI